MLRIRSSWSDGCLRDNCWSQQETVDREQAKNDEAGDTDSHERPSLEILCKVLQRESRPSAFHVRWYLSGSSKFYSAAHRVPASHKRDIEPRPLESYDCMESERLSVGRS